MSIETDETGYNGHEGDLTCTFDELKKIYGETGRFDPEETIWECVVTTSEQYSDKFLNKFRDALESQDLEEEKLIALWSLFQTSRNFNRTRKRLDRSEQMAKNCLKISMGLLALYALFLTNSELIEHIELAATFWITITFFFVAMVHYATDSIVTSEGSNTKRAVYEFYRVRYVEIIQDTAIDQLNVGLAEKRINPDYIATGILKVGKNIWENRNQ